MSKRAAETRHEPVADGDPNVAQAIEANTELLRQLLLDVAELRRTVSPPSYSNAGLPAASHDTFPRRYEAVEGASADARFARMDSAISGQRVTDPGNKFDPPGGAEAPTSGHDPLIPAARDDVEVFDGATEATGRSETTVASLDAQRQGLKELHDKWEARFRQCEVEASLERAELFRMRKELESKSALVEEQLGHLRRELKKRADSSPGLPNWMVELGLVDPTEIPVGDVPAAGTDGHPATG